MLCLTRSLTPGRSSPQWWAPRHGPSKPVQHDCVLLFAASVTSAAAASIGQVIELSGPVSQDEEIATAKRNTNIDERYDDENTKSAEKDTAEQKPQIPSIIISLAAPSVPQKSTLTQTSTIMPVGIHTRIRRANSLPVPVRGHAILHKRSSKGSPYCFHHGTACVIERTSRISDFVSKLTRLEEVDEEGEQRGLEVVRPMRR